MWAISKPQQRGDLDPRWAVAPQKKKNTQKSRGQIPVAQR